MATKKEINNVIRGLVAQICAAQMPAGGVNEVSEDEARTDLMKALRKLKTTIVDTAVPPDQRPENCELSTWTALEPVGVSAKIDALVPPPKAKAKKGDDDE